MVDNPFGPGGFGAVQDNYYHHPHLGNVRVVDVPSGGGWIYQFMNIYGVQTYTFVPNMGMWAQAYADAWFNTQNNRTASRIGLDTSHYTDRPQRPPNQGRATS